MKNLLTTIPKSKFKTWAICERVLEMCDGETLRPDPDGGEPGAWFWLINTMNLPVADISQSVCFMIFDGQVRGYFYIVDQDKSENWRDKHAIGKERTTDCIVMANWHPVAGGRQQTGFQGWRYTGLQPF